MSETTPTNERLDEIAARAEKATPGPWDVVSSSVCDWREGGFTMEWIANGYPPDGAAEGRNKNYKADAQFIAHARTDIPDLLALVASLTAERDGLKERAAATAETFMTCGCNRADGPCLEDDVPRAIAAAIRALTPDTPGDGETK